MSDCVRPRPRGDSFASQVELTHVYTVIWLVRIYLLMGDLSPSMLSFTSNRYSPEGNMPAAGAGARFNEEVLCSSP